MELLITIAKWFAAYFVIVLIIVAYKVWRYERK